MSKKKRKTILGERDPKAIGKLVVIDDGHTWPVPVVMKRSPERAAMWVWGDLEFARRLAKLWNRSLKDLAVGGKKKRKG